MISLRIRLLILWMLIILGMILHFNYHVSEIFYGIDVVREGANGTVPVGAHLIKNIFYHIPLLLVVSLLYFSNKAYRLMLFIAGLAFTLAHAQHLAGEFRHDTLDPSQVPLLSIVLLISVLINFSSWNYFRETVQA